MPILGLGELQRKLTMLEAGLEGPMQAVALKAAGNEMQRQVVNQIKRQGLWRTGENFAAGVKVSDPQ